MAEVATITDEVDSSEAKCAERSLTTLESSDEKVVKSSEIKMLEDSDTITAETVKSDDSCTGLKNVIVANNNGEEENKTVSTNRVNKNDNAFSNERSTTETGLVEVQKQQLINKGEEKIIKNFNSYSDEVFQIGKKCKSKSITRMEVIDLEQETVSEDASEIKCIDIDEAELVSIGEAEHKEVMLAKEFEVQVEGATLVNKEITLHSKTKIVEDIVQEVLRTVATKRKVAEKSKVVPVDDEEGIEIDFSNETTIEKDTEWSKSMDTTGDNGEDLHITEILKMNHSGMTEGNGNEVVSCEVEDMCPHNIGDHQEGNEAAFKEDAEERNLDNNGIVSESKLEDNFISRPLINKESSLTLEDWTNEESTGAKHTVFIKSASEYILINHIQKSTLFSSMSEPIKQTHAVTFSPFLQIKWIPPRPKAQVSMNYTLRCCCFYIACHM